MRSEVKPAIMQTYGKLLNKDHNLAISIGWYDSLMYDTCIFTPNKLQHQQNGQSKSFNLFYMSLGVILIGCVFVRVFAEHRNKPKKYT